MKKALVFIASLATICTALVIDHKAEQNYNTAIYYSANSEGGDGAIQSAMIDHGFSEDIFAEITYTDKLIALTK